MSEHFSATENNSMTMKITISAASIRVNDSVVIQKDWRITDLQNEIASPQVYSRAATSNIAPVGIANNITKTSSKSIGRSLGKVLEKKAGSLIEKLGETVVKKIEEEGLVEKLLDGAVKGIVDSGRKEKIEKEKKGNVRFILVLASSSDIYDSALTRKEEIEKSNSEDKLFYIEDFNLGKLKETIENSIKLAQKEGYGKTIEFSVFGHCTANDGPVGSYDSSNTRDLFDDTKDPFDKGQMKESEWRAINFNFDKSISIAVFYGCNSAPWAEKFLEIQPNIKHSGGLEGGAGGSYSTTDFSATYVNQIASWMRFGRGVYMRTENDGDIQPIIYYTQGEYENKYGEKIYIQHESWENLTPKK